MTTHEIIANLRNPYGLSAKVVEETRLAAADAIEELGRAVAQTNMDACPVCGESRPQKRPPGPEPIPRQWYCVNHRHLRPRRDYA